MFETSVVHVRAVAPRYRLLTLSLAVHSCAIAAVVTATLISVKLPNNAPKLYETPILIPAVTLPPALGTPHPKPAPAVPQQKRAEVAPATAAPTTIPEDVQPMSSETSSAATDSTAETGEGGEQGVPWGVKGGVPTTDTSTPVVTDTPPLRITGDVKAPVIVSRVMPAYPRVAMQLRKSGWVIVECIIDKTGHIQDAKVMGSSFPAFEQPALEAVQKWVFTPGSLHGEPVDTIFDLTVTFTLR